MRTGERGGDSERWGPDSLEGPLRLRALNEAAVVAVAETG